MHFYNLFGNINTMRLDITNATVEIDEQDLQLVSKYKWHLNSTGYAVWRGIEDGVKKTVRMHRLITGAPPEKIVDHINHNRLDNRRINLRVCTQAENMLNKRNQGKGYWYQKQNNNWVVEIQGKHRGCFSTEQEAKEFARQVRLGLVDKKPKIERQFCKYGHSLENAYQYKGYGKLCKTCQSLRSREYYRRKHADTRRSN